MKLPALFASLLMTTSIACLAPKLKVDFETKLNRWVGQPVTAFINANQLPAETLDRPEGGKAYVFATNVTHKDSLNYTEYTNLNTGARVELGPGSQPVGSEILKAIASSSKTGLWFCRTTNIVG
ncbi:MAG: hypothetical protein IPN59_11145 [Holophaga sp.]|nr:hypothetical protein [Holophaga sp.]